MQFRDLKAQYQALKTEIDAGIQAVIDSSAFILGKPVAELEDKLAAYVGRKHCVACGNGTDALQLALMIWGIGPGDAVFTSDFTYFASAGTASTGVSSTTVSPDVAGGASAASTSSAGRIRIRATERSSACSRVRLATATIRCARS